MSEDFFDRLDKYMMCSKLNDNQLTVKANLSIGSLGKQRKGSRGLSSDSIAKILYACPDLSAEWLLTGRGNIFNTKSTENVTDENSNIDSNILENKRNTQKTLPNESEGEDYPYVNMEGIGVPYYDVDFCGGFDLVFNDQTRNPDNYIYFPQYDKADSWANITGHSMEPLISNGDIIALKKLENWSVYILYGEVYGIMTDEYRTVKRIRRSNDPKTIILEPINRNGYDDQEIPREIITGVWKVLGCVKKMF